MDPKLLERYQSSTGAAAYRRKYERSWTRRLSNRRELAMVDRALDLAGTSGRVLDCPCGAGRLTPTLLLYADHVTCADISEAMILEAQAALSPFEQMERVEFAVAPANALPFEDKAFDTAVCHRLIHHMAEREERASVLAEMARVAKRRVILSFSDDSTRKGRSQRRRGIQRKRHALMPADLFEEAAAHGLLPLGKPMRLNGIFSLVAVVVFAVSGSGNTPTT